MTCSVVAFSPDNNSTTKKHANDGRWSNSTVGISRQQENGGGKVVGERSAFDVLACPAICPKAVERQWLTATEGTSSCQRKASSAYKNPTRCGQRRKDDVVCGT
jgi:hypothetical protein